MLTRIIEIEIPESILQNIVKEPQISLEKAGLLEFINKQLESFNSPGATVRIIWELFLKTKYLVIEKVTDE